MAKRKEDDFQIPKEAPERLARCILPEIQRFFESEEGKREFEEWKKKQAEEDKNLSLQYQNHQP